MLPKTFCILPFSQAMIANDGKARLCCRTPRNIMSEGRCLSLHQTTFGHIWNSDYLRSVRCRMLEGTEIEDCVRCYETEADGGTSLRQITNAHARYRLEVSGDDQILEKAKAIVRDHGGNAPPPSALHLWLGTLCNLKCRMCHPMFSSAIASDSVHSKWRGELPRSETVLPAYLDGVNYTGFGELVRRGEKFTRQVATENTTISLPANGDPIDSIEISGLNHCREACRLSLMADNRQLASHWLPSGQWKVSVRPDPVWHPASRIQLSLHFLLRSQPCIEIDNLKIVTRVMIGKELPREMLSRIPENPYWFQNEKVVFEELFEHPECLKLVQFSGGEPLVPRVLPTIIEKLVNAGHAAHIALYINSNGTMHSSRLSALLTRFASMELALSVDGVGKLQEYIRPPSRWDTISRNILAFQRENVPVSIRPTVQAYNIFGLLELARWCGKYGLRFVLDNILWAPPSLSLDMLPQVVIDEALEDWVEYLHTECTEDNKWHVESVIATLRRPRPGDGDLSVLQDEFIRFTSDLDQSRGQSFATACPRLHDRLVAAGFDFSGNRLSRPERS